MAVIYCFILDAIAAQWSACCVIFNMFNFVYSIVMPLVLEWCWLGAVFSALGAVFRRIRTI